MVNKISIDTYNEENNKIDKEENFEDVDDNFKLILMASYTNEKNSFINDLLIQAKKIDEKYRLNKFDYLMRTSDENKWNRDFIKEKFINYETKNNKLNLCGPVGFMEYMKTEFLAAEKVLEENISYV
jgi:hypothetical protein